MRRCLAALAAVLAVVVVAVGCVQESGRASRGDIAGRQLHVTATVNFITDLAGRVGGDRVLTTGLMGAGVDPHLYKASAGDVDALRDADIIFYGGLDLEGRMGDLLDALGRSQETVAVSGGMPESRLRTPTEFSGHHDPHVWFSVPLWEDAVRTTAAAYAALDPEHAAGYRERATAYLTELRALDGWIRAQVAEIPERSRVLVTSHDAFGYFGDEYGFEVVAIQGTSTATEATTDDIERVAEIIADRGIRSVFIEASVPRQTIDAVLAAARRRGQDSRVGGRLFTDAAGDAGTPEGTYVGMLRHNVQVIRAGLG